jgi:hypothetical protein
LREAIDRAPFLDATHFIDLDGKPVVFSWRRTGAKIAAELRAPTQVICLDDLLEFARDAIPNIAAWQLGRTVPRPNKGTFPGISGAIQQQNSTGTPPPVGVGRPGGSLLWISAAQTKTRSRIQSFKK